MLMKKFQKSTQGTNIVYRHNIENPLKSYRDTEFTTIITCTYTTKTITII